MRQRCFRSAYWTLLVCLAATTLLALCGYGEGSVIAAAEETHPPTTIRWPSQSGHPRTGPVGHGLSDARADELEERVKRLEAEIARLNGIDEKLTRADERLGGRLHDLESRPHVDPHTGEYKKLTTALQGQSRQLAALEHRLRLLREDFETHVKLPPPVEPGETTNTVLLFPLPLPIAIAPPPAEPPIVHPPAEPPPEEIDLDLDYEIPVSNAGRTETVTIHRWAAQPRSVRRVMPRPRLQVGLDPGCNCHRFSSNAPPWTTRW